MIRHGSVIRTSNDKVLVELDPLSACGSCRSGGCVPPLFPDLKTRISIPVNSSFEVGERVRVNAPDAGNAWLIPMLLAYGLPLAGLFAGVLAGQLSGLSEPKTIISGVLGFVGGLFAWHLVGKTNRWKTQLSPPLSNITLLDTHHEQPIIGPLR